jgi:hypothetical protein
MSSSDHSVEPRYQIAPLAREAASPQTAMLDGATCNVDDPAARRLAIRFVIGSRPRNGWLWPIDRAGHLVPFCDSHFSTQSLAQSLLVSPPFVRHACCLGTRGSDEHSFHDCFSFKKPTPDKRMHGQCSAASRSQWHPAPRHSPRGGQRREDGDRIASVRADEFEHGQAAIAANDRLAVDDAAPDRQGLDRLSDEREAVRKVVTVAGKEPRVATDSRASTRAIAAPRKRSTSAS